MVSAGRKRGAAPMLLAVLGWASIGIATARGAPLPFSPLPGLTPGQGQTTKLPGQPPKLPGLPPGPMLAQAEQAAPDEVPADTANTQARPKSEAEALKAPKTLQRPGTCRRDNECPSPTICDQGTCAQPQRPLSAVVYYSKGGQNGYRMVVPFYFSFWHPRSRTRVLFPFFGQHENDDTGRKDLILPLLLYQYRREPGATSHRIWPIFFYSDYGKQGAAAAVLPIFFHDRKGPRSLTVLPPLFSYYRSDREKHRREMLLLGLVWSRTEPKSSLTLLPPLLSYYRSDESKKLREVLLLGGLGYSRREGEKEFGLFFLLGWYRRDHENVSGGLFPVAWYSGDKYSHNAVVLPLYFSGSDDKTGVRHTTLFPLFHYQTNDTLGQKLLVTPIFASFGDSKNHVQVSALLTPPWIRRDTPQSTLNVLPPIAAIWHNKERGTFAGYFGPVFWSRDDEGSSGGLLPIYYRFHDQRTGGTTHVLLPIAALHTSPVRAVGFLGPLYGWHNRQEPGGGGGLLPLFSFATGARSHFALVPPLFIYAHDRDAGTTHVSLGPLFYRGHGPQKGYTAGLFPLLFFGNLGSTGEARGFQMLLPVFYHDRGKTAEHLVLGPLFLVRHFARAAGDPDTGFTAGLFPVLWLKHTAREGHAVIPPLLWYARVGQSSVGVMGPVFWRKDPQSTTFGIFPLLYARTSTNGNLAQSEKSTLVVTPIGGYKRNAQGSFLGLGPFFHVRRETEEGRETTTALLPLAFFRRGPTNRADVVFPLFFHVRDGASRFVSAAFLYFGLRQPDLSADVLFPVFWRVANRTGSTVVAGPFFYYDGERKDAGRERAVGLLPLFGYGSNDKLTMFATPIGFYRHDRKEERTRSAFLLFYGDFQKGRADYGLFPLFFAARRGTATSWVAPLVYHSADPAQKRALTVLGPLYFGHREAATFGGLLPFFYGKNDGKGGYRFTFFPVVHLSHHAADGPGDEESTNVLSLPFGFIKKTSGFLTYLGPFYLRRDAEVRSEAVFPIFYHTKSERAGTSTTFLLPLFFRTTAPQSSLTAVTPLFWQRNTLTRSVLIGFPLVLDIHDYFQRRITAVGPLIPLVIRDRDFTENTTTWIFPPILGYAKRHADGTHSFAIFPVLWHFGGKERSTDLLLPIFWHVRRPDYSTTALIPLFGYYHDEEASTLLVPPLLTWAKRYADGRSATVIFPLFWQAKEKTSSTTVLLPVFIHWKNDAGGHTLVLNTYTYRGTGAHAGEWAFHLWPLFSFGRPRQQDLEWNVLGGLVGYNRAGPTRTFKLLWGIYIPMRPVQAQPQALGPALRPPKQAAKRAQGTRRVTGLRVLQVAQKS